MDRHIKKALNLIPPHIVPKEKSEVYYTVTSFQEKLVMDYTGIDFISQQELGVFEFWLYYKDAIIWNNSMSKEGLENLRNAWMLEQDKADITDLEGLKRMGGRAFS